ncbi:PREDICTED: uncharacterized protein LOC109172158 [Ipomoea nil]|uniref:uncharacterized protein LOC109172158 n=1 Tax=Ipomoea nil TaxID=35883 RepID=UPI000900E216|nr:PREDICTED: uncharacterized protein LOC109172158 [Ipomoea nil]
MKIPVSSDYEDSWYWHGDRNGCYTVKNGYKRIIGNYESNSNGAFDKWLTLWQLKIPPKWKTFLWRAISDILSTTNNLIIKRVDVDPICAMCGIIHEDTMHPLVLCGYATTILYHIWRAWNGVVWDACLPLPRKILATTTATLHAWRKVHDVMPNTPLTAASAEGLPAASTAGLPPFAAPDHATALYHRRCYVDVDYRYATNSATVGVILLDANGGYISAYSAPLPNCFSPLIAEAFAAKEALSWLHARGEQSVRLYTDCHTLQCYLSSSDDPPRTYIGYVIDSCKTYISTFHAYSVLFIPRSQNYLAHILASTAFEQATTMYWDSVLPDSISAYI